MLGLAALAVLLFAAVAALVWWTLPGRDVAAELPGLQGPVHVRFDPDGIPWITAGSELDAAAALGAVHARDRLFQMELMRRTASGRLSELAGPATLRLDRFMRTVGLRRRAEAELAGLDPDTRAVLDAYARGVNAWVARRGRFAAPEFLLLGRPEPWTPVDTLLWGKTMALYLGGNWRADLDRAAQAASLSPAVQRALWPDWSAPVPDAALGPGATRLAAAVPAFPEPFTLPDEASNEWAVDGRHSATGAPLLAGDPHLAFSFPSLWYLARVETPAGVRAGATAPGGPFTVLGHNGHIAWTFTTTGADTQDVFVETPAGAGLYQTPDGPAPFTTREERIRVRGAADEVLTVRETRHGPVLSDLDPGADGRVLAVSMAALQVPDTAATGLLALNRAVDVEAAGRAAELISAPVQNLLVADRAGIGLFTTGRVPIRRAGDGAIPVDGADGRHDWAGFAAGDALPHFVHPASGRLVNANERTVPVDFPVFMGADAFGDWRARRIRALLDAQPLPDADRFAAMQVDAVSSFARAVLPALLSTEPADTGSRRALDALRAWPGTVDTGAAEPLLFNEWIRRFVGDIRAGLGIAGAPNGPLIDVAARALTPEGSALCGGGCGPLLTRSLAEAVAALGPNWPDRRWGDVHRAEFAHPLLGRLPLVGSAFTWSIPQPGDDSTVFRGAMAAPGWASLHGSSFRGVYDLADLNHSLFALAPGQSGNPFSAHAGDLLAGWRDGHKLRLGAAPDPVSATLDLRPAAIGR